MPTSAQSKGYIILLSAKQHSVQIRRIRNKAYRVICRYDRLCHRDDVRAGQQPFQVIGGVPCQLSPARLYAYLWRPQDHYFGNTDM